MKTKRFLLSCLILILSFPTIHESILPGQCNEQTQTPGKSVQNLQLKWKKTLLCYNNFLTEMQNSTGRSIWSISKNQSMCGVNSASFWWLPHEHTKSLWWSWELRDWTQSMTTVELNTYLFPPRKDEKERQVTLPIKQEPPLRETWLLLNRSQKFYIKDQNMVQKSIIRMQKRRLNDCCMIYL